MQLIFERSSPGRGNDLLPRCDVPRVLPTIGLREGALRLPEVPESEVSRHYATLEKAVFAVSSGFYPLGSCTMKYNPALCDMIANLPGFTDIHPTQYAPGCYAVYRAAREVLCAVTGMFDMSFQPAAGAHGELLGLLLIKAYHEKRGDTARTKIIVPDSAHGTNPATAAMVGYTVVNVKSNAQGGVDMDALNAVLGEDIAGLMLTNPNTLGLFDPNICEITRLVHECGGLNYYDGANLNAILGVVRPGDMGFDCVHLNLHKTFATPHGGGGPGAGAVGVNGCLAPFLPDEPSRPIKPDSLGRVKAFHGHFLVVARAMTYCLLLGKEGLPEVALNAVLNANYLMKQLRGTYEPAYDAPCMHEFVLTLKNVKEQHGVSAMDIAKMMIDAGYHPPTMYFPLIVPEALMLEPTETETKGTLDEAAQAMIAILNKAIATPESAHAAPITTIVGRPDEVKAARNPVLSV